MNRMMLLIAGLAVMAVSAATPAALITAVQAEAKAQGWGVLRWITRDNNYRARGLYDKLAQKTDWTLYEMTAT